jgi:allantoin racemase
MSERLRILKTLPTKHGLEKWGQVNRDLINAVASDQCVYDFWELSDAPIEAIVGEHDVVQIAALHVELAQQAVKAGFDAIAMGCLLEPGVRAAKEILPVPVVGALEASVHLITLLAERFSIILCDPESTDSVRSRVRRIGLESRLASIRGIKSGPLEFAKQDPSLPERMLGEAQAAVSTDGASGIVTYGNIKVLRHLRANLRVPVVNPQQSQVLLAELLCRALA